VIGLFTGAQTLYAPLRHWIVNVRASYYDETREQMEGVGTSWATTVSESSTRKTRSEPRCWEALKKLSRLVVRSP